MNLHLYEYNNYYNRTLKSFDSIEDLDEYELFVEYNTNFNPNDSVFTEHIIGGPLTYYGGADYCVVEREGEIESRWFVLENVRTRGGQYKISLKRDVVADFATNIFNAPCFVEKGWVSDADSAIFNSENMTFNQIKKNEIRLMDRTGMPWLVGYYTKSDKPMTAQLPALDTNANFTIAGIANWEYYGYTTTPAKKIDKLKLWLGFKPSDLPVAQNQATIGYSNLSNNGTVQLDYASISGGVGGLDRYYTIDTDSALWGVLGASIDKNVVSLLTKNINAKKDTLYGSAISYFTNFMNETDYNNITSLQNQKVYDSSTQILYNIKVEENTGIAGEITEYVEPELTSTFGYEMYNIYAETQTSTGGISGARPTKNSGTNFEIRVQTKSQATLILEPISYQGFSLSILPTASANTKNSPYNIFAIPYGDIRMTNGTDVFHTSADIAIRTAMALIEQYSGTAGILHDVQLLPYCPIAEVNDNVAGQTSKRLDLRDIPSNIISYITDTTDAKVGVCFHCVSSSRQFSIERLVEIHDIKISNETEFCRLVSPNWNGMFEFSPAKNRGVEGFTVDMELKPFSPYIHVAPKWNEDGLYGKRPNDPIGLICGGDFGLTMISDAWASYERQNKNYQQIFDRQIQSLEVKNEYGRFADIAGIFPGAGASAGGGGILGSMLGGGAGKTIGIGAGVGAGISALGGIADFAINEALRNENMDYTKDQFGYQLGNIRALPDSLAKVNSFNPNNRIFPVLEFYGATDEEVEALRNKIKYNGMSIGRIGKLADFINPAETTYLKGQIIILEGILEDGHLASEIATEINKGVRV